MRFQCYVHVFQMEHPVPLNMFHFFIFRNQFSVMFTNCHTLIWKNDIATYNWFVDIWSGSRKSKLIRSPFDHNLFFKAANGIQTIVVLLFQQALRFEYYWLLKGLEMVIWHFSDSWALARYVTIRSVTHWPRNRLKCYFNLTMWISFCSNFISQVQKR